MIFRQLFDTTSWTYTYLLADPATGDALFIDSVFEQYRRDSALLRELGVKLNYVLETHVHADHVTAAWLLREHTGCEIVVSKYSGAQGADRLVDTDDVISFGNFTLEVLATPGHTDGCVTYVTSDKTMAFTGDALLIRGTGRTDFQQGDPKKLFHSVREGIFRLPNNCALYPAHDYLGRMLTTVREEKFFNPRLRNGTAEEDFVGYMASLNLPHPRQIDVAVPANLRCGEPGREKAMPETPKWAPIVYTHAGVWEINPLWVCEHRDQVHLVDVRSPEEFSGELGHIEGSQLIPLSQLRERLAELDAQASQVLVCQSGARSAQATMILEGASFEKVANLAGGMLRWNHLGLPTAR